MTISSHLKQRIMLYKIEWSVIHMSKIILQRKDKKLIDNIFEHPGNIFSVRFAGYEDTVWCKSISEIYIALEQFKRSGFVKTDENAELII